MFYLLSKNMDLILKSNYCIFIGNLKKFKQSKKKKGESWKWINMLNNQRKILNQNFPKKNNQTIDIIIKLFYI